MRGEPAMKLLFCNACKDIVQIRPEPRTCSCGKSSCVLIDEKNAEIRGSDAYPLGINNYSFSKAFVDRPYEGAGSTFAAFVIPQICDSVNWDPRDIDCFDAFYARVTSEQSWAGADAQFSATSDDLAATYKGTDNEDSV